MRFSRFLDPLEPRKSSSRSSGSTIFTNSPLRQKLPKMMPTSVQNRSKIDPRRSPESSKCDSEWVFVFAIDFNIDFIDFGSQHGLQNRRAPKIDLGAYQNPLLAPEGPQEASRDPFWTILDRSSLDVGPMLDRFRYHVAPSWGFIFRLFEVGHFSEFGKPGGPNGTWKIRVFFPALSHPACCLRGGRFRGRSPLLDPATEHHSSFSLVSAGDSREAQRSGAVCV